MAGTKPLTLKFNTNKQPKNITSSAPSSNERSRKRWSYTDDDDESDTTIATSTGIENRDSLFVQQDASPGEQNAADKATSVGASITSFYKPARFSNLPSGRTSITATNGLSPMAEKARRLRLVLFDEKRDRINSQTSDNPTESNLNTTISMQPIAGQATPSAKSSTEVSPSENEMTELSGVVAPQHARTLIIEGMAAQLASHTKRISSAELTIMNECSEIISDIALLKTERDALDVKETALYQRRTTTTEVIDRLKTRGRHLAQEYANVRKELTTALAAERDATTKWLKVIEQKKDKSDIITAAAEKFAGVDKVLQGKRAKKEKFGKLQELLQDDEIAKLLWPSNDVE